MIKDNTILSSFDERPTLLEWLKKVEDALKTDTATAVSVDNPSANTYVFKITFADGETLSSGNVVFPDSVKDVSIKNGHIVVTSVGGNVEDLGVINPYADTIVLNAETNDVEINGETKINAGLEVVNEFNCDNIVSKGAIQTDRDLSVTGNATIGGTITAGGKAIKAVEANPTGEATQTLEKIKIGDVAYNLGGGGGGIKRKNLYLQISLDFTDVTTENHFLKYKLTQAGNAKLDNFIDGINHDSVISLYCEQIIVNGGGQVPDNTAINTMYGTFDIPANLLNELAISLTFPYENGNFAFFKVGEQWYYGFSGSQATDFIINPTGLELFIYYL